MKPPSLRGWIGGLLAFVAIVAPWPIALFLHYHLLPFEKLIGEYTIGRYTGVIENQSGPVWYYLPVIVLGFFPWIAFLPMAIVYGVRQLAPRRATAARAARAPGFRLDRHAVALLQFRRHEASKLYRARITRARAPHRALFRRRRPQGRNAFGGRFGRDRAGDDWRPRARYRSLFAATTVLRPRSPAPFHRCLAWRLRSLRAR